MAEKCETPKYPPIVEMIKKVASDNGWKVLKPIEDREGSWLGKKENESFIFRFSVMTTTNYPQIGEGRNFVYVSKRRGDESYQGSFIYQFDIIEIPKLNNWFIIPDPIGDEKVDAIKSDFKNKLENANIEIVIKSRGTEGEHKIITANGNNYTYYGRGF